MEKEKNTNEFANVKLSEELNNEAYDFKDGLRLIQLSDGMYNYVDKENNLLSKQNFKVANPFFNGFAWVQLQEDEQYYFIDKDLNFFLNSKTPLLKQ
jgi:hypothetical protein